MDKDKVLALAELARIRLTEAEAENLSHEFDSILKYVGEVQEISAVSKQSAPSDFPVRNVMREDGDPHESGLYTEKIMAEAPSREGDYVKVKKIL